MHLRVFSYGFCAPWQYSDPTDDHWHMFLTTASEEEIKAEMIKEVNEKAEDYEHGKFLAGLSKKFPGYYLERTGSYSAPDIVASGDFSFEDIPLDNISPQELYTEETLSGINARKEEAWRIAREKEKAAEAERVLRAEKSSFEALKQKHPDWFKAAAE